MLFTVLTLTFLKDENKADTALNADPDVIQVVQSAGQYQVVIGSHVSDVYKDLMANSGLGNDSDNREKVAEISLTV